MEKSRVMFLRICFYIGVIADLLATILLIFPQVAEAAFGLTNFHPGSDYLYASRIGASLMLGWTLLLLWGSFKPIERKEILLLTVLPVLVGLLISSIFVVSSGFIEVKFILPLWIFYVIIIPLYIIAYIYASKIRAMR